MQRVLRGTELCLDSSVIALERGMVDLNANLLLVFATPVIHVYMGSVLIMARFIIAHAIQDTRGLTALKISMSAIQILVSLEELVPIRLVHTRVGAHHFPLVRTARRTFTNARQLVQMEFARIILV